MNKPLIAFGGFKSSGKSTATEYLTSSNYIDVKFAAPLKFMLYYLYAYNSLPHSEIMRRLEGDLKEVPDDILLGNTPRWAMQSLGTEWRNMLDENLWTEMWTKKVQYLLSQEDAKIAGVVCSDARFIHEITRLKSLGGIYIWINRPGTKSDGHASEQDMSSYADYVIDNVGTLDQLYGMVDLFLNGELNEKNLARY